MRSGRESGFTLVELLVAMAILSLLTVYSLSALSSVGRMNAIISRIQNQEEIDIARRFLATELASTQPVYQDAGGGRAELIFTGEDVSISFVSLSDGSREIGGLYQSTVYLAQDGGLMMSRRLLGHGDSTGSTSTLLLAGVKNVSFSYYACEEGGPATPRAAWPDTNRLPHAVSVAVKLKDENTGKWPPVLIALAAASC